MLLQAVDYEDTDFACKLAQRGIHAGDLAKDIIDSCWNNTLDSLPAELLRLGMQISPEDYSAMYSCLDCNYTEAAAILLERGMDFDAFRQWAAKKNISIAQNDALTQIEAIWTGCRLGKNNRTAGCAWDRLPIEARIYAQHRKAYLKRHKVKQKDFVIRLVEAAMSKEKQLLFGPNTGIMYLKEGCY